MKPPPGPPQSSGSNPQSQPGWFDRYPGWSILLQILAIPVLGAAAFFLWIFDAEKYSIGVGVLLIVLVFTMITTPGHNALGRASTAEKPPSPHP